MVTRVDQDFDIRRVQTQAEKFLPKAETVPRGRKRKAQQGSKQKSSTVRWVYLANLFICIHIKIYSIFKMLEIIVWEYIGNWKRFRLFIQRQLRLG